MSRGRAGCLKDWYCCLTLGTYTLVRIFKSLITDIQTAYGDAKKDLLRSLVRFDKSLQGAGLLLLKRVDNNVGTLLSEQQGLPPLHG